MGKLYGPIITVLTILYRRFLRVVLPCGPTEPPMMNREVSRRHPREQGKGQTEDGARNSSFQKNGQVHETKETNAGNQQLG